MMVIENAHWGLLVLGAIALVILITRTTRSIQPLRKQEDGSRNVVPALVSIAREVLTNGAPSFVLLTGFVVVESDELARRTAEECVLEVQAVVEERLPLLIEEVVAERIPYIIPDLQTTPAMIEEILEDLRARASSLYTLRSTLRSLPSELDDGSPSAIE